MLSFISRFFWSAFSSSPSQPDRPGSFSAQELEQRQRIDYREDDITPALQLDAIAVAPAPLPEQQLLTEGEDEDVAIPMLEMETVEQIKVEVEQLLDDRSGAMGDLGPLSPTVPVNGSTPLEFPEDAKTPDTQKQDKLSQETKPVLRTKDNLPTTPDYIPAEVFLETIGFFTPSSKRLKNIYVKEKVIGEKPLPDGTKRKIKAKISANHELGLPITIDQDYWRAFQKICYEAVDRDGRFRMPLKVPTKRLLRYAGKTTRQRSLQEAREWLKLMTATLIEGGLYRAKIKDFQEGLIVTVFSQVIIKGEQLLDGKVAETNYVWLSPWFLSNYFYRHLRPVDLNFYQRLRKPIAKALYPLLETGWYASEGKPYNKSYHTLCSEFLLREYHHLSDIKRQLDPAHQELEREHFLASWEYRQAADKKDLVITWYPGEKFFEDQKAREERRQLAEQMPTMPKRSSISQLDFDPSAEAREAKEAMRELIVRDILEVTNDPHSKGFYHLVARKIDEQTIRRALSETKEADRRGEIRTNRGRYFTDTLKRYASQRGITL